MPKTKGDSTRTPPNTEGESANALSPTKKLAAMSTKAKIEERLQRAIDAAPATKNRSPELVPLTAEYDKMRKNCTYVALLDI
jgi:hypothetical protein